MSARLRPLLWLTFDRAARSHPDAAAFVDGATSISYGELHARALANAARLRSAGLGATPGAEVPLVALIARDPAETLACLFGALEAGASVAPLAPTGPEVLAQLRLLRPHAIVVGNDDGALIEAGEPGRARRLPPGITVCTAGTTGAPKAVVHSHTTLGHAVRRLQLFRLESAGVAGRTPADERELAGDLLEAAAAPAWGLRYATTLPLTTMAGLTVALQALLAGDALVLPPTADATVLLDTIAATGVTNLSLTPFLAQLLLRAARQRPTPQLEHLLFVGIGGGPVAPSVPAALEAAIGCPVAIGYGTTEAGGAITMGRVSDSPAVRHETVGRALPGVDLTIDPSTSELRVRCASTALGYITGAGRLTELGRDEFSVGDLASLRPDGAIELRGRRDALILRGGRNIDPVRIERALEDHPAVRRAGAFGVSNWLVAGEQDIWTVVELDHTVEENELRAHCNRSLGASLTPRRIIAVDALPLTVDGGVRRHELARLADPQPRGRTRAATGTRTR